jgi:tight adherence protein B
MKRLALAVLAALVLPAAAGAGVAIGPPDTSDYPTIRLTSISDRPVAEPPRLRENGRRVPDLGARNLGGDKAIAIAVDVSESMTGKPLNDAVAAARLFLRTKREGDRVALFTFGSETDRLTGFSDEPDDVASALDHLAVSDARGTALYETIEDATDALAKDELVSRVLIVITDGHDVSDRGSLSEALGAARDVGVAVYPIGIASGSQFSPAPLQRLARATGGAYSEAESSGDLLAVSDDVRRRVARTWELTYRTAARPGQRVRLALTQSGAGDAQRVLTIPRDAGRPPAESALTRFLFHSAGGNLLAALALGAIVLVAAMCGLGARNVRRIRRRLEPHVPRGESAGSERSVRKLASLEGIFGATENAFGRFPAWRKLRATLERADSSLRPAEFLYIMLGAGLVLTLLLAVIGAPLLVLVVGFPLGAAVPYVVLVHRATRRQKAFDDQLPDLLMTMAGSLRAGHTFRQAMQAVVEEGAEPAAKEFKRVLVESGFGRPVDRVLTEMAGRLGSRNFEYVISVVSIQREVGGSLANLFDMVSETVRQRQQFSKKVRGLTAMGRMSAYVLVGIPFFLVAVLTLINPAYMAPLFKTPAGQLLIGLGLTGIVIGSLILKKIVSFRMA